MSGMLPSQARFSLEFHAIRLCEACLVAFWAYAIRLNIYVSAHNLLIAGRPRWLITPRCDRAAIIDATVTSRPLTNENRHTGNSSDAVV